MATFMTVPLSSAGRAVNAPGVGYAGKDQALMERATKSSTSLYRVGRAYGVST